MKKILLLGASGMLGSALAEILARDFAVTAKTSVELDLLDYERVEKTITDLQPDFVVNAAAYTAVDDAERDKDFAMAINGGAVSTLALACRENNATLIHFSTDYVFDGEKTGGYLESDPTKPINAYGRSKLAGEQAIQASGCRYAIIRTSWLFGPNGKNFVDTMLELGKNKSELKVVYDQVGCPTFTKDLAGATRELLLDYKNQAVSEDLGALRAGPKSSEHLDGVGPWEGQSPFHAIFHLTNSEPTSWADFAVEIFRQAKLDVKVIPITSKEFSRLDSTESKRDRPAKRPKNSVLLNTKRPQLRSWQKALGDYLNLTTLNSQL